MPPFWVWGEGNLTMSKDDWDRDRNHPRDEDEREGLDDQEGLEDDLDEGPQSVDLEDLGGEDEEDAEEEGVEVCPNCESPIFEDTERCPKCGEHIIHRSESPLAGLPWWAWLIILAGAAGFIYFFVMR